MRIAYIAPFQGPDLLRRRPIVHNRSLAGTAKIEMIADLLSRRSHQVDIISQGEVDKFQCRFYPSFSETQRFNPNIPVCYSSALPVRFLSGFWEAMCARHLLKVRHNSSPYDVIIIYNTKRAQLACADYAIRCLNLPVILEYEDDSLVNVLGHSAKGLVSTYHRSASSKVFKTVAGCMAASPLLLSRFSSVIPTLLLRGVVGDDIVRATQQRAHVKKNWVLFSGTHTKSKGIEQLIKAWEILALPGWELHITGFGEMTDVLRRMAYSTRGIAFHGLVDRQHLVNLYCSAKICINPHDLSLVPGNVFAFKIIEYLAAGAHVVTTPMGALEKEIESGITYMHNNTPETISATLKQVIATRRWQHGASRYVSDTYGLPVVAKSLDLLLRKVVIASATPGQSSRSRTVGLDGSAQTL